MGIDYGSSDVLCVLTLLAAGRRVRAPLVPARNLRPGDKSASFEKKPLKYVEEAHNRTCSFLRTNGTHVAPDDVPPPISYFNRYFDPITKVDFYYRGLVAFK